MAIAHEWLASRAGGEKVFEALAEAFPTADLYALTREPDAHFDLGGRAVTTTFLDRLPALRRRRDLTLPLMPLAWNRIRVHDTYDVVITSSHACVKAFPPAREALHYCFCHSPMRYAWEAGTDRREHRLGPVVKFGLGAMREWDRRSSETVDFFGANSTSVRERVADHYGRDAEVLYAPVDTDFFTPFETFGARPFALAVSRFVPYKRLDVAIQACAHAGLPLVVAGSGPEAERLRRTAEGARADVTFEIGPSDERLRHLYRGASMLIFPADEDLGLIPIEAQACGTPVVGLDRGGSRDTVIEGVTGRRVERQDAEAFAEAVEAVLLAPPDPAACRENAERFSRERFKSRVRSWVSEGLAAEGAPQVAIA